jgi:hypothetical protein
MEDMRGLSIQVYMQSRNLTVDFPTHGTRFADVAGVRLVHFWEASTVGVLI